MLSARRVNVITVLLLVAGLGSSLAIYLLAAPEPSGDSLLNDPRAERKYHHDLALYGGKGNVVAAEFMDWFGGLWHGRPLAGTVAVLTLAGIWVFRFAAGPPPSGTAGLPD